MIKLVQSSKSFSYIRFCLISIKPIFILRQSSDFVDLQNQHMLSSTSGAFNLDCLRLKISFLVLHIEQPLENKIILHTNVCVIIKTPRISWRTKLVPIDWNFSMIIFSSEDASNQKHNIASVSSIPTIGLFDSSLSTALLWSQPVTYLLKSSELQLYPQSTKLHYMMALDYLILTISSWFVP